MHWTPNTCLRSCTKLCARAGGAAPHPCPPWGCLTWDPQMAKFGTKMIRKHFFAKKKCTVWAGEGGMVGPLLPQQMYVWRVPCCGLFGISKRSDMGPKRVQNPRKTVVPLKNGHGSLEVLQTCFESLVFCFCPPGMSTASLVACDHIAPLSVSCGTDNCIASLIPSEHFLCIRLSCTQFHFGGQPKRDVKKPPPQNILLE